MASRFDNLDLREFIENFRHRLASADPKGDPELGEMLQHYGNLCQSANTRLRQCAQLSRQGQYANALSLANQEPKLLDYCSLLEVPERQVLPQVAKTLGISPPIVVNHDLIEMLQDADKQGSSTEDNQRKLHKLTLARAPLPTRLVIMRRLLRQNANNPFIDEDIRTFEKAWFQRANLFAQNYVRNGDVDTLQEILADFEESGYLETPPPELISEIKLMLSKARARQLPALAEEIRRTHADGAIWPLKQLANQWNDLVTASRVSNADQKFNVADAFSWLANQLGEERRKEEVLAATARLAKVLGSTQATRKEIEQAYLSASALNAVDELSAKRYEDRLQEFDRRKRLFTNTLIAVPVLSLFGLVLYKTTQFPDAPTIETVKQKENAHANATELPIDPNSNLVKVKIETELDLNDHLAKVQTSINELLNRARTSRFGKDQVTLYEQRQADLAVLGKASKKIGVNSQSIEEAKAELSKLKPWCSLANTVVNWSDTMSGSNGSPDVLGRISHFLSNELADSHPVEAVVERAKSTSSDLRVWIEIFELEAALRKSAVSSEMAKRWEGLPPANVIHSALETIAMLRERDYTTPGTKAFAFRTRMEKPDIKDVYQTRVQGAESYSFFFTKDKVEKGDGKIQVKALVSESDDLVTVTITGRRRSDSVISYQSVLSSDVKAYWADASTQSQWNNTLARMFSRVHSDDNINPILKLQLVRLLLTLAVDSSVGYREILRNDRDFVEITGYSGEVGGNWRDPSVHLGEKIERAKELCKKAPLLRDLEAKATQRDELAMSSLAGGVWLIGVLAQNPGGDASISRFKDAVTAEEGNLFTVSQGKWIKVGASQSTDLRLESPAVQYLGWPVFLVRQR